MTSAFTSHIKVSSSSKAMLQNMALQAAAFESLDDGNYNKIMTNPEGKAVLVDACAQWCGPVSTCKTTVLFASFGGWWFVSEYSLTHESIDSFVFIFYSANWLNLIYNNPPPNLGTS